MKTTKRILALVLALTLLCSMGVFASADYRQPFQKYLVLGDSIPIGKSDDSSRIPDEFGFLTGGYPQQVANFYNVPQTAEARYMGAHAGWRVQELRVALEDDYYGDEYTNNEVWMRSWGGSTLASIKEEGPTLRSRLADADLVTINLGSNNLLGTLSLSIEKALTYHTAGTPCQQAAVEVIEQAKQKYSEIEAIVTMLDFALTLENAAILIETLVADFTEAMAEFPYQWEKLMDDVFSLAKPEATIVVLGLYNSSGTYLVQQQGASEDVIDIANMITKPVFDCINNHLRYFSAYRSKYVFVDTYGADLSGSFDGAHLGQTGHDDITQRIINALKDVIPCDHNEGTHLVNFVEPTKLTLGYSGDTVCDICGRTIERGRVTIWQCTHANQKLIGKIAPTVLTAGYSGNLVCTDCGKIMQVGHVELFHCDHQSTKTVGAIPATRLHTGYTGNEVCTVCGKILQLGKITPIKLR